MKIIDKKLYPEEGYKLKEKNDNGETLEDGTFIEPYLCDIIYLAKDIETLDQAQEIYEEISIADI